MGIAVDTVSQLVFYTDFKGGSIARMTMNGKFKAEVINQGLESPRDIVLDPTNL